MTLPMPEVALAEKELAAKKMPSWRLPVSYSCSSMMSATIEPKATLACTVEAPWMTFIAMSSAISSGSPFSGSQSSRRATMGIVCQNAQERPPKIRPAFLPKRRKKAGQNRDPSSTPTG